MLYYLIEETLKKVSQEDLKKTDRQYVAVLSFEEWQQKYESKYGHKLAEKSDDPKSSFIFKLSLEELKNKVFNSEKCKEIIHAMYPKFPRGLSKADSVILLFDKLVKENRISDLKLYLLNKLKR